MQIKCPTLIVDRKRCCKNISVMADKAMKNRLIFRPHFKTHQSAKIGRWFRQYGINAICVSSVSMARYFADDGWEDITIAFPVNPLETEEINELAGRISLNILLSTSESLKFITKRINRRTGIFIEIDDGYHRSGIEIDQTDIIRQVMDEIRENALHDLRGFLVHSGHTYKAASTNDIKKIIQNTIDSLRIVKEKCSHLYGETVLSIGDTPSCSILEDFTGIDEIRPGNFVFYDAMQYLLGSCSQEQIAVGLACPVVAKYPRRNEIVIYGGSVHLSKESVITNDSTTIFGLVAEFDGSGWGPVAENTYVNSLSQEHGIIKANPALMRRINVGDVLLVIPVHSCLTADLQDYYLSTQNEKIEKMRKSVP